MLIIGLGNPGEKYSGTRHNIGFEILAQIIEDHNFSAPLKKFNAYYFEGGVKGKKIRALMPITYMNLSGNSVAAAVSFYKIPLSEIYVFHDELDLPLGKLRIKTGGGDGGHNGLKSIDEKIGKDYKRIRVGIGHPGDKDLVSNYVLSKFSNPERPVVDEVCKIISDNFSSLVEGKTDLFATKFAEKAAKFSMDNE